MNEETAKLLIQSLPQIIGAIASLVTAIIGAVVLIRQGKIAQASTAERAAAKIETSILAKGLETKLDAVHEQVNGQSQALLKVTGEAEHAKGMKEEKENPS